MTLLQKSHLYIGGQWLRPHGQAHADIVSPANGEPLAQVVLGDAHDVDAAVTAARAAFASWSQTPPEERAQCLERAQALLQQRADETARLLTQEMGMPLTLSKMIQVGLPLANLGLYAQMARTFQWERTVGHSRILHDAVGVVAAITPWNYPLHQIVAKVAPALAAGCTVVLKPSEVAPLNAFVLAEILHEAGVPAGVFNLVTGTGADVGEALVTHPDVDMVSFTGSTRAGKRIGELAAATVKRVSLELGGKSASVVLPCADLAAAVAGTVQGCLLNSGQTCSALTRLIVPQSRYAEAAAIAVATAQAFKVGDPMDADSLVGPLVSSAQRERVREHIERAIADGAELLVGGTAAPAHLPHGWYVQPTLFGKVDPDSALAQQEVFGPVLAILTYDDASPEQAIALANHSLYGLSGAVWAGSDEKALAVARRLRTGQVAINGGEFNLLAPFGGYKQSGHGRELGEFGLHEFLEIKSLQLRA